VDNISSKVKEYVELKRQIERVKAVADSLEGELILHAEKLLADTKYKSIRLTGDDYTCAVTATTAETLKVTYPSMLKQIFGKVYSDCVKEETTYTVNAHGKRILIALLTGAYSEGTSLEKLITGLGVADAARSILLKKLKGVNFDTDKKTLARYCSLSDEDASDYAYMVMEAVAWQNIENLLYINGLDGTDIVVLENDAIKTAAVDQTVKVSVFDGEL
jgi:hypothetical protein